MQPADYDANKVLHEQWFCFGNYDGEPVFRGFQTAIQLHEKHNWNGFAIPLFTKDESEAILDYMAQDGGYDWTYDAEQDAFVWLQPDDHEEAFETYKGIPFQDADGSTIILYGIGAWSWAWQFADEDSIDMEIDRRYSAKLAEDEASAYPDSEA